MNHSCPFCTSDKEEDGFEALDEGVIHEFRCEGCSRQYYLYFVECQHCMNDSIFTWASKPSVQGLKLLDCKCCSNKINADENLVQARL